MKRRSQKSKKRTPREPTLFDVLLEDFLSSLGYLFPVCALFFSVLEWLDRRGTGVEPDAVLRALLILSFIVGPLILVWRLRRFSRLLSVGQRVPGTIISVTFHHRWVGWLVFSYEFGGLYFSNSYMVWKSERTSSLEEGMPVTVLVDPESPSRSVVLDLYM